MSQLQTMTRLWYKILIRAHDKWIDFPLYGDATVLYGFYHEAEAELNRLRRTHPTCRFQISACDVEGRDR